MSKFSERYGYRSARSVFQIERIDDALRNALWDAIRLTLFNNVDDFWFRVRNQKNEQRVTSSYIIWNGYFKIATDEIPLSWSDTEQYLRNRFMTSAWFEVYDFLEFLVKNVDDKRGHLRTLASGYLKREMAAYSFAGNDITPITDDGELSAVESALSSAPSPVRTHLAAALTHLSDRTAPDYRNSVKESISAVEAAAQDISGNKSATLGQALKLLPNPLPPAFAKAVSALYGYTSDENGIRHALSGESTVDLAEARFMLVVCSAFINLLRQRTNRVLP